MADLSKLSTEELIRGFTAACETNKLLAYQPPPEGEIADGKNGYIYPWQMDFHRAGASARERLLICANGVGKCTTFHTNITLADGSELPIGELEGQRVLVQSWDGSRHVPILSGPVFRKPAEPCYRVVMSDGRWFEAAGGHRVYVGGSWQSVERLLGFWPYHPRTSLELGRPVRASDGRRSFERPRGSTAGYPADHRFGDALLHDVLAIVRAVFPSPADAPARIRPWLLEDGPACSDTSSPSAWCARRSTYDSLDRWPRRAVDSWGILATSPADEPSSAMLQSLRRLVLELAPWLEVALGVQADIAALPPAKLASPSPIAVNEVVEVYDIGSHPVYDLEVPGTNCYFAAGALHHNTWCVSAELAMHATGLYPDWWPGVRFDKGGFEIWVGSIDNEMQKIGLQEVLMGPDIDEAVGTGFIPRRFIGKINRRQSGIKDVIDESFINHVSGKRVLIRWKTFEQGEKKWQSGKPKIIVWDEEPDENNVEQKGIFSEMQTRLVRNNGIFFGCRTPLYGQTALIRHFQESTNPAVQHVTATWDDAPHMDAEARARALEAYPEHERATRSSGIIMMGEGAIFTTPESQFVIDPIQIPDHWARIKGIDFGLAHPAAVCSIAWDRDTGVKYLYHAWRDRIKRTSDHVEAINRQDMWVPVAWPHDGEKRDPKSGERLADAYRKEPYRVNMLGKSARYKNDVGGSQAQWPIIEELRAELASGMLKVFSTCKPWLEEYRNYHTKDGVIMATRDDVLKASFYAYMMLRFAVSKRQALPFATGQQSRMTAFTTAVR